MDKVEKILIAFIIFFLALCVMVVAQYTVPDALNEEPKQTSHLPSACAIYYNDGTQRWIDCMGVGYK